MSLDNPNVRASTVCPLCSSTKARGLVACWTCYKDHDLRNGNPEAELQIAAREQHLAAFDAPGQPTPYQQQQSEHKVTAALPSDEFDKVLSRLIGLPNGAHTQPSVVQAMDFYGNTTSFMIQTVKTDEGVTAFVTQVNAHGSVRYTMPQHVLAVIDRQRAALTTKIRRRHGKRIAEERKAAGIEPFKKARKG